MNILFVANRFPYPPFRGDKLKIYNLAKMLSNKHTLYLLTFIQKKSDYKFIPELQKYFKHIEVIYLPQYWSIIKCIINLFSRQPYQIIYFSSSKFKKLLNKFLESHTIDVIHTQHLRMSQYTSGLSDYKIILDLPDAYSLYWERRSKSKTNVIKNIFHKIEYKKVLKYEEIIKKFDLNLVCSYEDKEFLEKKHNINNIELLPNGVDLETFIDMNHDYSIDNRIIFTGNMDYYPNIDAAVYFVNEIFPLILKKLPSVKFFIVGQNPGKKIMDLQNDNVIVTGFVKDLYLEYLISSIAVSPIRYGAGTLNKVLEPMAMGIPVISTIIGFKGLGVKSGEGVVLAENTSEFVCKVLDLLQSESMRKDIGRKGKEIVRKQFGWDNISGLLEKYFERIKIK